MSQIYAELLTLAKKFNNYEIDPVTGLKVLWLSTTSFRAVVPTGKRWFVIGGVVNRNVSSTLTITIRDSSNALILRIQYLAAATGISLWPSTYSDIANMDIVNPIPLDAGEYFDLLFGTAQDAGSYASCMVLEVDV